MWASKRQIVGRDDALRVKLVRIVQLMSPSSVRLSPNYPDCRESLPLLALVQSLAFSLR
jgi:hypothetical protein